MQEAINTSITSAGSAERRRRSKNAPPAPNLGQGPEAIETSTIVMEGAVKGGTNGGWNPRPSLTKGTSSIPKAIDGTTGIGNELHGASTPAPLGARYVRAGAAVPVTLHQPGKTARSPHRVITGRLLGEMHARGVIHHYRVEGDDGVLYLAPPTWIAPECNAAVSIGAPGSSQADLSLPEKKARILSLVREIAANLRDQEGVI